VCVGLGGEVAVGVRAPVFADVACVAVDWVAGRYVSFGGGV
jgi:hypothetical protein